MEWIESAINNPVVRTVVVAGSLCGALTAIGIAVRRAWRASAEFFRLQHAAGQLISAQLTRNHGESLLDRVNEIPAIRTEVRALSLKVGDLEKTVHAIDAKVKT